MTGDRQFNVGRRAPYKSSYQEIRKLRGLKPKQLEEVSNRKAIHEQIDSRTTPEQLKAISLANIRRLKKTGDFASVTAKVGITHRALVWRHEGINYFF